MGTDFTILIVGQAGRIGYEAALLAASLRRFDHGFKGKLVIAEPQPGPLWPRDPRISDPALRTLLTDRLGAEIRPFESRHFGGSYPNGNKIEALRVLEPEMPFVFFDSDTLILGPLADVPFDFDRPTASLRREDTWPKPTLYGPGYTSIWKSLYDRFGLDFESSLDTAHPDEYWKRYLYFNAGFFFYRCPWAFGDLFESYACAIRDDPPAELATQELYPWLDQIALPLVVHALGGGRDALAPGYLDGRTTCHWRLLPLLYAREDDRVVEALEDVARPNWFKKVVKTYEPFRRMIYQGRGAKVRALFDRDDLPKREQQIRGRIRREGLWMR
ncbi:MAG: hypothetical protein AAGF74_01620 [Pseudomonadota bacterium]